jgi:hypothetical protein
MPSRCGVRRLAGSLGSDIGEVLWHGVACSIILLAMEPRLRKRYGAMEGVVQPWKQLTKDNTENLQ